MSASSTSVALAYDPTGRLEQEQVMVGSGSPTTTQFVYDGARLVAEYDGSGNLLHRYVHGAWVDEPIVWYVGADTSQRRWLHADNRGSIIAWSDASGSVNQTQTFAYGPNGEAQSRGGSRFAYTGQIALPEVQLYHYKARAYDPVAGRFLQTDPIGTEGGLNLYAYVNDDPLNLLDPMGWQACVAAGSKVGSTCVEASNATASTTNFGPVAGENQGVLQTIHQIDTANPPETSYAVEAGNSSSGTTFSLVKESGTETNTSNTTGLTLNGPDYAGAVGEAHPHPYEDYSPDVGPEDPIAAYKLGLPVYTRAPGTVTVTGMVNGQFYTQYLQGSVEDRSTVQNELNSAQSGVNNGSLGTAGAAVSASQQPSSK